MVCQGLGLDHRCSSEVGTGCEQARRNGKVAWPGEQVWRCRTCVAAGGDRGSGRRRRGRGCSGGGRSGASCRRRPEARLWRDGQGRVARDPGPARLPDGSQDAPRLPDPVHAPPRAAGGVRGRPQDHPRHAEAPRGEHDPPDAAPGRGAGAVHAGRPAPGRHARAVHAGRGGALHTCCSSSPFHTEATQRPALHPRGSGAIDAGRHGSALHAAGPRAGHPGGRRAALHPQGARASHARQCSALHPAGPSSRNSRRSRAAVHACHRPAFHSGGAALHTSAGHGPRHARHRRPWHSRVSAVPGRRGGTTHPGPARPQAWCWRAGDSQDCCALNARLRPISRRGGGSGHAGLPGQPPGQLTTAPARSRAGGSRRPPGQLTNAPARSRASG
mmetsp:Transcript_61231/g.189613  ORF Transcript_61231/g.189613 Transcript_61231/m.189613 type:complete len:387 (+) Transcript_61231:499-1659(+)